MKTSADSSWHVMPRMPHGPHVAMGRLVPEGTNNLRVMFLIFLCPSMQAGTVAYKIGTALRGTTWGIQKKDKQEKLFSYTMKRKTQSLSIEINHGEMNLSAWGISQL